MRFLGFSIHQKGVPRQEISKRSTVCSTFSRSGWSVVRSAWLATGGTSKKKKRDRHRTSTKFRLGVIRWFHRLYKRPSCKQGSEVFNIPASYREIPGSNPGPKIFNLFSSVLQANSGVIVKIDHDLFLLRQGWSSFSAGGQHWKLYYSTKSGTFKYLYRNQHKTERYIQNNLNLPFQCETWACLCSVREFTFGPIFKCQFAL
jgi:hypothetical protein